MDSRQGINWSDMTCPAPPGLHTRDPEPGADLVSSCTADRPEDLSQRDRGRNFNRISTF